MSQIFVSSTEHDRIFSSRYTSSTAPERYGADFVWFNNTGEQLSWFGVQRKAIPDLFQSIEDGRLAKELIQLKQLDRAVLLIEGTFTYTLDGVLMLGRGFSGRAWTKTQVESYLHSIRDRGIWVDFTPNKQETLRYIESFHAWSLKDRHRSGEVRPKAPKSWGNLNDRSYGVWFLQSIDGIGPELAGAIFDHFGRVPLKWDATREELKQVKGLGPKKVDAMLRIVKAGTN